jgi:hypothetical protein
LGYGRDCVLGVRTVRLRHSACSQYAEAEKERRRHSESEVSSVNEMDESG